MAEINIETVVTDTFSMDLFRFGKGKDTFVILPGVSVQSVMSLAEDVAKAYSPLAEKFTVYLFDRRKELPASYTVHDMARDTVTAIKALELEKISIFGASQGGMMAMDIAIEYPALVRSLVLASTTSCIEGQQFKRIGEWIDIAKSGNSEALYLSFGEGIFPKEVFEQYRGLLTEAAKTVTAEELERFVKISDGMRTFDVKDKLGEISCPVQLLGSEDDKVFGADALLTIAERLKDHRGFELYMYNGYGHAVYDTAPDFKERILKFLVKSVNS